MRIGRLLFNKQAVSKLAQIPTVKIPPDAKVTLWGISFLTQTILLDLKISPLLKEIRIFDKKSAAVKLSSDLKQIQTNSLVLPFYGHCQLGKALRDVDVIVLAGGYYGLPGESKHSIFKKNLPILLDMAYECANHNPTASVVVLTPPGTRNVPMIAELYEKLGLQNSGQIMSPMYQHEMVAAMLVSETVCLPSNVVNIPIVGGCCTDTIIPIFSRATPQSEFMEMDKEDIIKSLRTRHEKIATKQRGRPASLSTAMAASKLILDVVKGRFGMKHSPHSVFLRSNVLLNVKYLGIPVEFGPGGSVKESSMPQLDDTELKMLAEAVLILQKDAEIATSAALARWNELDL